MMKLLLILCFVVVASGGSSTAQVAAPSRIAANAQHTYEFGACEQQLMWRDGGKLAAQLEHLDAMKKAGCGWVRLSLIYPTNLDVPEVTELMRDVMPADAAIPSARPSKPPSVESMIDWRTGRKPGTSSRIILKRRRK